MLTYEDRAEQRDEDHPADMTCDECGSEWFGNWTRGSRVDPPEPRNCDCPNCSGEGS
jgi:hypothetical protein